MLARVIVLDRIVENNSPKRDWSRFSDLIDSITEIFVAVDAHWRVTWLNRSAIREGGLSEDALGKVIWDALPDLGGTEIETACREAMAERRPANLETWCEARRKWFDLRVQPTSDGLSALVLDITERKRLEEKLRETARLESLGLLAGGIAHDFNNLLTGILGGSSYLLHKLGDADPGIQSMAEVISRSAQKAAQLTGQMLAYSGRGRFVLRPLDFNEEIEEMLPLAMSAISHSVTLELKKGEALPLIEADASQIHQVILNLLINASEAQPPDADGGSITVTTEARDWSESDLHRSDVRADDARPGTFVCLSVADTGHGMDAATKARIFDPFFTTKFTGRGLGLAAVMGIVRGHRGAIFVDSSPGRGARFVAGFPVTTALRKLGRRSAERPMARRTGERPLTILVVDDEQAIRDVAGTMLNGWGHSVLLATNGQEGVEVFRARADEIGLVLLDMTMPVLGGEQALRLLREVKRDIRVIASSGYSEEEARHRFGEGLAGFLQKPYSNSQLRDAVAAVVST
jgi:PAS domain S-box-containing protein